MSHTFEPAKTGRSKCRGCNNAIARGETRFGERLPNPFDEGSEAVLWFHPRCAAFKRPESLFETLATSEGIDDAEQLARDAKLGLEHPRLARIDGAERAPTGRAKCRCCHSPIDKATWRIRLVWFEEGRFAPSGFVHLRCAQKHFGTTELIPRISWFAKLSDEDKLEIARELGSD